MKLSLYSGNLSTFYKSIYYFDGGQKFMHVSYNKWSLVCISMQLSREWSIFTELYENTLQCTITICTALIHFRNYSSFPKLLHIFVDVTPCYGQELPVVDSATGLEYNCGIYGVECPRSSFCHQTASFAKCCPKGRKS